MKKKHPGLSFVIAIGKYAGFHLFIKKGSMTKRLCLGWISLTIYKMDIETFIVEQLNHPRN